MTSSSSHQTTLLIGGSNGTATLCAILGDKSNPINANHTLRVATRSAHTYLDNSNSNDSATAAASGGAASPRVWRCQEKKHISDLLSANFLPTRVVTHVGAPDSVFVYGNDNDNNNDSGNGLSPLERAISGISAPDNGGVADVIILACPVSAHLALLRRLAKALYNLDARGLLGSGNRPPIFIGTLYGAGGFDWMSRIAFYEARPSDFTKWNRPLGLFGLKAFPYLCKSLTAGEVTLHGRFPQLQVAISPSNAYCRHHVQILLDRVLQNETTGKKLEFLGLSSNRNLGGDGTVGEEAWAWQNSSVGDAGNVVETVSTARNAMVLAAQTHKQLKQAKEGSTAAAGVSAPPAILSTTTSSFHQLTPNSSIPPSSPTLELLLTHALSDHADPYSSLGFLSCTLNSTNQILHPCILVALFGGKDDSDSPIFGENDVGMISWNTNKERTPLPRFYADGAARPLAGQLITSIAGGEMYFVIDAIERLLSPRGYDPITALHGGEPIGRQVMNWLGNSPHELGERSGLTSVALRREWQDLFGKENSNEEVDGSDIDGGSTPGLIHREGTLAKLMGYGLTHNSRLGAVLSPCIIDEASKNNEDGIILIKPNPTTRFFTDDVQHGLCIYLGLAELLGFDLERDMKTMLYVVRRLQHWMKKEFVLPEGKVPPNGGGIVSSAKDMGETSAPQAFGVRSVQELRQFLRLDVFGEVLQARAEDRLKESGLVSRL